MGTHDFAHETAGFNAGPANGCEIKVAWTKPVLVEMSVMEGTETKGSEVSESSTTKNTS